MPSIIFDFDSTLVSIETLDHLLAKKIQDAPTKAELAKITDLGMRGEIPFSESLVSRLKFATLTKSEVDAFARTVHKHLTPGMLALIENLHRKGWECWILSGGLKEIILPCAKLLGINTDHVNAVEIEWDDKGQFIKLKDSHPFNVSKVAGAKTLNLKFGSPSVAVGDGMTDFLLYDEGIVEYFVAFTCHKQHQEVIDKAAQVVGSVGELGDVLWSIA